MYVIADGMPIKILSFNMTLLLLRVKSAGRGHWPVIPCYLIFKLGPKIGSQGSSSTNDVNQDDHDGDHQQNVNKATHGVGRDESQEPQDDQNNCESV
jgi:hypothetical protein